MDLDLLVVGGGVSGLAAAREARVVHPDWEVAVLEAGDRPGGTMWTESVDGCLCEWGPNGFLTNVSHTVELARDLGIGERLLPADPAADRRYLFVRGRLRPLPMKPPAFLTSSILSVRGRIRVLFEPVKGRRKGDDESVFSFAKRRIGREAARVLVDAMVSGIHAGDSTRLSLKAAFPRMAAMEDEYRSLLKAMKALKKKRKADGKVPGGGPTGPGGKLTSFDEGMAVLIRTLAGALGDRLRTGVRVASIEAAPEGLRVSVDGGGSDAPILARSVVLATPAYAAARILSGSLPEAARLLDEIPYAPITVACLVYERDRIAHPLDGFGFLAPVGQGLRMLGCIFTGSVFPAHVREGATVLRAMVGGARDPAAAALSDGETVDLVRGELGTALGEIRGAPSEVRLFRHPRGIPQYELGHLERLAEIEREIEKLPGLMLAGNAYRGIGVNDCVREARALWGEAEPTVDS